MSPLINRIYLCFPAARVETLILPTCGGYKARGRTQTNGSFTFPVEIMYAPRHFFETNNGL